MLNNKKNKKNKKAFTIVELVIVIAVIAILAAVLIPTFASIIKKANDSAYLQERTNQTIIDSAEEIENPDYLSWKDFEAVLAQLLIERVDPFSETEVQNYFQGFDKTNLSEAQIKQIIERTLDDEFSAAMVEPIVRAALASAASPASLSLDDDHIALVAEPSETEVKTIVDAAVASLGKEICITAKEMTDAIEAAIEANGLNKDKVETTVTNLSNATLTETEITAIINAVLNKLGQGNDTGDDVGGNPGGNEGGDDNEGDTEIEVLADGADLDFDYVTLEVKKTYSLHVRALPSTNPATYIKANWKSSDTNVINVDETGKITAGEPGLAVVTATVELTTGSKTLKCAVVVNPHRHTFNSAQQSDTGHSGTCKTCGEEVENEPHHYDIGNDGTGTCACGYKKANVKKCTNVNHTKRVSGIENSCHKLTCDDCHVTFKEDHKNGGSGSTCTVCGLHTHVPKPAEDLGDGYHKTECHYCPFYSISPHSCQLQNYTKDASGHSGTCQHCQAPFSVTHTPGVDCAACNYTWCKHKNPVGESTIIYVPIDNTDTHHQICTNGNCEVKVFTDPEAHDTAGDDGKCSKCGYKAAADCTHDGVENGNLCSCNQYIFKTAGNSLASTLNKCTKTDHPYLIIVTTSGTDYSQFNKGDTSATVVVDLGGDNTVTFSNKAHTNRYGNLTFKNGTLKFTGASSISMSSGTTLTLQDVIIDYSGTSNYMIAGASNSNISITGCEITSSKPVIRYNTSDPTMISNAKVEISDSKMEREVLVAYAVAPTSTGNKITFNNVTDIADKENNVKFTSSEVDAYIQNAGSTEVVVN